MGKKIENKKTRLGLGLTLIFVTIAFFISVNVFYNKTSLAYALLCFIFIEFWGAIIIISSMHEEECFFFRFIIFLFGKQQAFAFLMGIIALIMGLGILITFILTGSVPIREPHLFR